MNKLLKIFVFLAQLGGSVAGLGLVGNSLLTGHLTKAEQEIHVAFAFVFFFGIIASAALIFLPRLGLVLSAMFQAIQIPVFIKSAVSYALCSGACLNLFKDVSGWGYKFIFGSRYSFNLNSDQSWMIGVNAIALFFFIFLVKEFLITKQDNKSSDFQPCQGYSSFRCSKMQPYVDNNSPLRRTVRQ